MRRFFGEAKLTILKEACRVAERYTPEQFEQLMALQDPQTGYHLCYQHVAIVLRVADAGAAEKAIRQCVAGNWTTKQLGDYVTNKVNRGNLRRQLGSSHRKPRHFPDAVDQILAKSADWLETFVEAWESGRVLRNTFAAFDADKITDKLIKRLEAVEELTNKVAASAHSLAAELRMLRRRAETSLQQRRRRPAPAAKHKAVIGRAGADD
jgi:hypothetical protein